jgi:hypothetical protein
MLRRVAPPGKSKVSAGHEPGSEAFKPSPESAAFRPGGRKSRDNGGLSTKRAAEDPKVAYWKYLRSARPPGSRQALGTWGFTVGQAQSVDLPAHDDGGLDDDHPENHATVWFPMPTELPNARLKLLHDRKAEDLLTFALANGCLFQPDDPEEDARSLANSV